MKLTTNELLNRGPKSKRAPEGPKLTGGQVTLTQAVWVGPQLMAQSETAYLKVRLTTPLSPAEWALLGQISQAGVRLELTGLTCLAELRLVLLYLAWATPTVIQLPVQGDWLATARQLLAAYPAVELRDAPEQTMGAVGK